MGDRRVWRTWNTLEQNGWVARNLMKQDTTIEEHNGVRTLMIKTGDDSPQGYKWTPCPSYVQDLDRLREVENTLTTDQITRYMQQVTSKVSEVLYRDRGHNEINNQELTYQYYFMMMNQSVEQRAEGLYAALGE